MTPQFKSAVETYGPRFMADLGLTRFQVSGIFGNLAVESDQFRALQEYKPTVRGSKGGWGWPQWTGYGKGGRRGLFEAWADANSFKRDDPEAFYGFMLVELRGSEKAALTRLKRTTTLDTATEAFMKGYERPGVPHLDRRKAFALEALHVLEAKIGAEKPAPTRAKPKSDRMAVAPVPGPTLAAPRVETVAAPSQAEARRELPFWQRWLVKKQKPASVVQRPGLKPGGNPELYDVQAQLRDRVYYTRMPPDGLDGPITQAAVTLARKDHGLGDGGIDATFLAKLPSMGNRLIPEERRSATLRQAATERPDLFGQSGLLGSLGLGSLGIGLGDGTGLFDKAQSAADKIDDVAGKAQSAIGSVHSFVDLIAPWRSWILVAVGLFVLWRAARAVMRFLIDYRQLRY